MIGLQATTGNLGHFTFSSDEIRADGAVFTFPTGGLKQIAKVGDLVKLVIGSGMQSEQGYFEYSIVQSDLTSTASAIEFLGNLVQFTADSVYAVWLESSDATKSTSSKFREA